jgi:hypothetical protein
MSIVVGTLTIDLKANTASFSQSMDKMSQLSAKSANDIKRSLEKIGTAGLALRHGLAAATVALVETSIATIGSLSRLSQATGTTVEKFSALAYAARISHVEVDDMAKGMEKLAKSAFGAQNGNAGLAADLRSPRCLRNRLQSPPEGHVGPVHRGRRQVLRDGERRGQDCSRDGFVRQGWRRHDPDAQRAGERTRRGSPRRQSASGW